MMYIYICIYVLYSLRPVSVLRFRISEGLTQAESSFLGVGILRPTGNLPEIMSQRILVARILVRRLGVPILRAGWSLLLRTRWDNSEAMIWSMPGCIRTLD